ncbi:MAG: sugar ABC transporter permease [Lachnospiraceae bacterium]|nr:sugar ABC transporter permease [Lachnospiraceae bacterium]
MRLIKNTWKNRALLFMALPAVVLFILFNYVPMFGLVLAFKEFNFSKGIWGSEWCGLENFKYLFMVGDTAWRLTRNTVGYYLLFTAVGTVANVAIAICINEMVLKRAAKFFQSCMILPNFISYIAVSFVVYAFLKSDTGIVNKLLLAMGGSNCSFYLDAEYWPLILLIVKIWKETGYGSVLYLSVLTGIDPNLYEAASIDGAGSWQKLKYITLPFLVPMVITMTLLGLGSIMHSDTGLFYQVTKNSGALYSTTQVFDSYVLNSIMNSVNYGMTSAVTFFQSVVGFIMVMVTNLIIRRYSPENALF